MPYWITKFSVALLALFVCASPLYGQALRGVVRESGTARPVDNANVILISEVGDSVVTLLSGSDGTFLTSTPRWGSYIVSITRLGYLPLAAGPLRLVPGDTLRASFEMSPIAVEMEPLVVQTVATIMHLQDAGFYWRKRKGIGHFVEPEKIEERRDAARSVVDFLVGIPGVHLVGGRYPGEGRMVQMRRCGYPRVFVDDVLMFDPAWRTGPLEDVVSLDGVLAIEVFRGPSETPMRYSGAESACGAVLIWTDRRAR